MLSNLSPLVISAWVVLMALQPIELNRFELFVAQYLPHYLLKPAAPFHHKWYAALDDDSIDFLAIESGRMSAKSTIASVCAPLYWICERNWPEFQTFSQSGGTTGMSTKWMRKIQREIDDNELLRADYGLQRGGVWTNDHIQVVRGDGFEVDLYARGKGAAARGGRGCVLIDDPQDEDDCNSQAILERDEGWLLSDILPILGSDQRLIFIGTPISPLSLLSKVKDMPEFKVLSFPAEHPLWSGKSTWPEQWPDEYLAKRLSMMGRDRYGAEYLCAPRVSGNPPLRAEWFKSFDPDTEVFQALKRKGMYVVMGMDCAESKSDQADNTAYVVLGATFDAVPDIYVLEVGAGQWTTKEGAERVLSVFDRHQQHKTLVESRVKHQVGDAMIVEIRERERIYGKHVNLYPVKPERDKVARVMYVQSLIQGGQVYVNRHDKEAQSLLSEATMFTDGSQNYHDDRLDALVHALTEIKDVRPSTRKAGKSHSALAGVWS